MAEATLNKIKFQPLADGVLVKPVESKEIKRGGIIIPDSAKEKPQEGTVITTGKGKTTSDGKVIALDVKAGDLVLYRKYSGSEIKFDGEDYLILTQEDILGILK